MIDAWPDLISVFYCTCQGTMGCQKTCKVEKLLKQSQRDAVWSQRQRSAAAKKNSRMRGADKVSVRRLFACVLFVKAFDE